MKQICLTTAIVFFALAARGTAQASCVQVQVGGQNASLACLNQNMQSQALEAAGQAPATIPLAAGSASNAIGIFNQAGVAEQYGKNFGVSVTPYRPPPPVFANSTH